MLRASEEYVDDPPGRFSDDCDDDDGGAGAGRFPGTWGFLLLPPIEQSLHVLRLAIVGDTSGL